MGTALDLQEIGLDLKVFGEIDDPNMRHFNPSLAWYDDQLIISVRSCNFKVKRHGDWSWRDGGAYSKTDVLVGRVNPKTLEILELEKLFISDDSPTRTRVSGLEDIRLYFRKDGMRAIGFESDRLTRSLHNASASLAEYLIDGYELKYLRTLEKPNKDTVEKNWSPTDEPSREFDFSYSPSQVWKDGELIGIPYKGQIHGGSALLKQKDGTYLSLVHKKTADLRLGKAYDRYVYHTYLARHRKDGIITHITPPFTFGTHENIEFASGMVEYDNDFIISLGIRDCKFALARIPKIKLTSMLQEYKGE